MQKKTETNFEPSAYLKMLRRRKLAVSKLKGYYENKVAEQLFPVDSDAELAKLFARAYELLEHDVQHQLSYELQSEAYITSSQNDYDHEEGN